MTHLVHSLANGFRVILQPTQSNVSHLALIINTGSRDERNDEHGMAHFIEHNLFKGTKKRKAYHILSRLDDVGGELNAYTTKEETVIHASFLPEHLARSVELIADIVMNSTFPERELRKEKDVIRDEIHSYIDNPSELIFDDFENLIFAEHPMGRSILGTEESLEKINRDMVLRFIARNYVPSQMILSVVGPVKWHRLLSLVQRYFEPLPFHDNTPSRKNISRYEPQQQVVQKETLQTHAIIGNRALSLHHKQFTALFLLNNLLGGPAMNNRLTLNIREKYGFTYYIESFYSPFTDCGLFGIYLGTHKGTIDRSMALVFKELKKLREKSLGTVQLHKAQKQLMGQIALSQENNLALAIALGRSLLHYHRIDTLEDVYARINAVSAAEVRALANQVFNPDQLTTLIFKAR
jgi:predicted Zn-dependent peptidase